MLNRYAFINSANGIVLNIVQRDDSSLWQTPEGQTAILLTDENLVEIGWVYNGGDIFSRIPSETKVEKIDFMRRFTIEETIAMNALRKVVTSLSVPDYSDATKQQYVALEIILQRFDLAMQIELAHPETIQAINALVLSGVITQARAEEILK